MTLDGSMTRWGIPNWTDRASYPKRAADRVWRWEFLRRRPDYREAWEGRQDAVSDNGSGILSVVTDDHETVMFQFGVPIIYDPRRSFDDWTLRFLFRAPSGFLVCYDPHRRKGDRLVDYRFDLTKPLKSQLAKAERHLSALQKEVRGTPKTPRPSPELWSLYLRVIDARDCQASWQIIGDVLWPAHMGDAKDKARSTYKLATAVRDNFPA
jgi:hypothetical protein